MDAYTKSYGVTAAAEALRQQADTMFEAALEAARTQRAYHKRIADRARSCPLSAFVTSSAMPAAF